MWLYINDLANVCLIIHKIYSNNVTVFVANPSQCLSPFLGNSSIYSGPSSSFKCLLLLFAAVFRETGSILISSP